MCKRRPTWGRRFFIGAYKTRFFRLLLQSVAQMLPTATHNLLSLCSVA